MNNKAVELLWECRNALVRMRPDIAERIDILLAQPKATPQGHGPTEGPQGDTSVPAGTARNSGEKG